MTRGRGGRRLLVSVVLATMAVVTGAAAPAPAATAQVTKLGNMDATLRGNYPGTDGSQASFGSPTIADLDGDGETEIITATVDGRVIAYHGNRTVRWVYDAGRTSIQSSPAVADITGDRKPDVVVGTMDGRVLLIDGPTGKLYRSFSDGGLQGCQPTCFPRGFHATPAIGDVNGDGIKDIVASSYNHFLYAWSRGGTRLFKINLYDTSWSSPAVVDIDGNGTNEVIVGSDLEESNPVYPGTDGGMLWVIRRNGSSYGNYPNYPKRIAGQTIWSSPGIADINGDNRLDIVVGTGIFYPSPAGHRVYAFSARTGAALPGWPVTTNGRVLGSPAIGDVTGDGRPEVSFISEGGYLYMYNGAGGRMWAVCDRFSATGCASGVGTFSSPVLADVDADGVVEVVSATENKLRIRTGSNGAVEDEADLRSSDGNATVAWSSPTVGEIGGQTTILYQAHVRKGHTGAYARAGDIHRVQAFSTGEQLCDAPWPAFRGGPWRNGRSWQGSNPVWLPFSCPGDFVDQQYRDFLGRSADAAGRRYWSTSMREGRSSGSQVIEGFLRSPEFGGDVDPVVRISFGLTGSYPTSAAAVRSDVADLREGTSLATIAQRHVDADTELSAMTDAEFVTAVYQNLYSRNPTSSELSSETGRLAQGTTRGEFVVGHVTGATQLDIPVDVTMVYLGMLDRAPDAGGFAYWVSETTASGPQRLIRGVQTSAEYASRVL